MLDTIQNIFSSDPPVGDRVTDQPSFYAAAAEAASLLLAGEAGVLLTGSPGQANAAIELIQGRLDTQAVMPVIFLGSGSTPERLRSRVAEIHAARPKPDTRLLLVIADADALQPELLQELELAAGAAAQYGGLQFLFGSNHNLRLMLQSEAFYSLASCFDSRIQLPPLGLPGVIGTQALRGRPPARRGYAAKAAIAASLSLLLMGGFLALRPGQSDAPAPTMTAMTAPPRAVVVATATPKHAARKAENKPILVSVTGPSYLPLIPMATTPPPAPAAPATQLLLVAGQGDTLPSLYRQVYRGLNAPAFATVAANNPQEVRPGTRLMFPSPADGWHLAAGP